jgi:hypothetical protein
MNIRNIIRESLLNEGEATHKPFRFKRKRSDYKNRYTSEQERDNFDYNFKTKEDFIYNVNIDRQFGRPTWHSAEMTEKEWQEELAHLYRYDRKLYLSLMKLGATREDLKTLWRISFSILDGPKHEEEDDSETEYEAKVRLGLHGDVDLDAPVERDTYSIWRGPSMFDEPNKGEFYRVMSTVVKIVKDHVKKYGGKLLAFTPLDDRRGRIFSHFIMKQMPGSKTFVTDNDFYFLLNV